MFFVVEKAALYYLIDGFGAVLLEAPSVAEHFDVDFRDAARRRLEVVQRVVVEVAAKTADLLAVNQKKRESETKRSRVPLRAA